MNLSEQEIGMGLVIVTCICCGNVHKKHGAMNACDYSLSPNYGCSKCQGIPAPSTQPIACEYKGVVSSIKKQQKIMNTNMTDVLLANEVRPLFEEYYSEFKFGFGSNWMKPLFKEYFWWGYFAGYKKGQE